MESLEGCQEKLKSGQIVGKNRMLKLVTSA